MSKDTELWRFIISRLKQKCEAVLLVVAASSGSSPGRQGFKMAVAEDEFCGSIGGGVMEISLVERAKEHLKTRSNLVTPSQQSEVVKQVHRTDSSDSSGMICSGEQSVILYMLSDRDLKTAEMINSAIENDEPRILEISNRRFQISDIEEPSDSRISFEREKKEAFRYREQLSCPNKLFIVGGGHCALALSEVMSKMDFQISLFDDRHDLNTLDKNKYADEISLLDSYQEIGRYVSSGMDHYVVVMTIGYLFDKVVIKELLEKDFRYFGVLGSKAKMKVLLREIENEGFSRSRLDRIHTPIGLDINSQTPFEIAISIAAEIVAVKNAKG